MELRAGECLHVGGRKDMHVEIDDHERLSFVLSLHFTVGSAKADDDSRSVRSLKTWMRGTSPGTTVWRGEEREAQGNEDREIRGLPR
jgi:hypothetical protein